MMRTDGASFAERGVAPAPIVCSRYPRLIRRRDVGRSAESTGESKRDSRRDGTLGMCTMKRRRWWIAACLGLLAAGCRMNQPHADIAGLMTEIARIDSEVAGIKTGDIKVGGDGDTVTTWILAIQSGVYPIAGALCYLLIFRPLRLRWGRHKTRR